MATRAASALVAILLAGCASPRHAPSDSRSDEDADTDYVCVRARDGRTAQLSQIAGIRSRTWKDLIKRADGLPIGGPDGVAAHEEIDARMDARCDADEASACCARRD